MKRKGPCDMAFRDGPVSNSQVGSAGFLQRSRTYLLRPDPFPPPIRLVDMSERKMDRIKYLGWYCVKLSGFVLFGRVTDLGGSGCDALVSILDACLTAKI